jgi:hypothetical protein
MRIRARYRLEMTVLCAALGTVGLLALSGCASSPAPIASPSASPTADAPAFASEADALEAARKSFTEYQALSTQIGHEGGASPERMSAVATGEVLAGEITSLKGLSTEGLKGVGTLAFDRMSLQSADLNSGQVETYLCLDVSATDLVDSSGVTVVPANRPLRYPMQIGFRFSRADNRLLVETSEQWLGSNFC